MGRQEKKVRPRYIFPAEVQWLDTGRGRGEVDVVGSIYCVSVPQRTEGTSLPTSTFA